VTGGAHRTLGQNEHIMRVSHRIRYPKSKP